MVSSTPPRAIAAASSAGANAATTTNHSTGRISGSTRVTIQSPVAKITDFSSVNPFAALASPVKSHPELALEAIVESPLTLSPLSSPPAIAAKKPLFWKAISAAGNVVASVAALSSINPLTFVVGSLLSDTAATINNNIDIDVVIDLAPIPVPAPPLTPAITVPVIECTPAPVSGKDVEHKVGLLGRVIGVLNIASRVAIRITGIAVVSACMAAAQYYIVFMFGMYDLNAVLHHEYGISF